MSLEEMLEKWDEDSQKEDKMYLKDFKYFVWTICQGHFFDGSNETYDTFVIYSFKNGIPSQSCL